MNIDDMPLRWKIFVTVGLFYSLLQILTIASTGNDLIDVIFYSLHSPKAYGFIHTPQGVGNPVSVPAGCDNCSGTLVMGVHFEDGADPHDIDDSGVSPCGCTDGSDDTADFTGGASVNSNGTYVSDGSYSANVEGEDDVVEIDTTGLSAAYNTTGTYCVDYYHSSDGDGVIFDVGDPHGTAQDGGTTLTLRMYYGASYYSGTDTFNEATMTRICYSWDASQSAGSDRLATKVGASSWESNETLTLTDNGLGATAYLAGNNNQYGRGYIDNIKWYSDYQHAE